MNQTDTTRYQKRMAQDGLTSGVIVEVEGREERTDSLQVNIKGYHLTLDMKEASKIRIKPIR